MPNKALICDEEDDMCGDYLPELIFKRKYKYV